MLTLLRCLTWLLKSTLESRRFAIFDSKTSREVSHASEACCHIIKDDMTWLTSRLSLLAALSLSSRSFLQFLMSPCRDKRVTMELTTPSSPSNALELTYPYTYGVRVLLVVQMHYQENLVWLIPSRHLSIDRLC